MAKRSGLRVDVVTPAGLKAAADKLRAVDKRLPGELRKLLRDVARPIMQEQKKTVRPFDDPTTTGSEDLSRAVARGVKLKLRTGRGKRGRGASMRIITSMDSTGGKSGNLSMAWAPRALDTAFDGWRAPVFYDGTGAKVWEKHSMAGEPSWFMGPASRRQKETRMKISQLLKASASEIQRAAISRKAARR